MAGIQISGLLSNSAFDWKEVVDKLVTISRAPINTLNKEKESNLAKASALADLGTKLTELKDAMQAIRADEVFRARTVVSDNASTTWKSSSVKGSAIGSYTFDVTQLATQAQLRGASDIGGGLAATSDVSGLTLANAPTAKAITAGTFTVAGQQVTVALTDSLQDVFTKISTATGGGVTASYNPTTDRVTLTKSSGELVLGAANDTSNFLSAMKLANNGTATTTSGGALGTTKTAASLATAGLRTAITAVDGSGNGSFSLNGVSVSYNVNTDTLTSVISRINEAGAGVTASYDAANDRVVLLNEETGDLGISVSESSGGLLGALGLTSAGGGTLVRGKNAQFTVNGGDVLTSTTNTLDATAHGVTGLSVTVNTATKQTLQVESDTQTMDAAIGTFLEKFNALQDYIDEAAKVTVTSTGVTTGVLASNREVQAWAGELRRMAFNAVSGVTGGIDRLDDLGIDFDGTSSRLVVKDSGKLATALGDDPESVESLFVNSTSGLVPKFYDYLGTLGSATRSQTSRLTEANLDIDDQVAVLESRIESERTSLTNSFIKMLEAQQLAQTQNTYLTNTYFKNSSS
ncbi:MAG: flagellar filament capping protein FliD [Verrucomicrobia bacterium]|nr:flagellar filament capping protein FliD [Verrucomicrobiota bacterium]